VNRFGGGRSLFDDFFSDFFGDTPAGGRAAAPTRQVERVDVTQFFSYATRELSQRAAQTALRGVARARRVVHARPESRSPT